MENKIIMVVLRAIKDSFYFLLYFTMTAGWTFSGIRHTIKRDKFFSSFFV